jgi:TM2 domain-containing membrane protein YozV
LEIKSKKEEKIELKRLQEEERKLKKEEKDLAKELKELKKGDTIDKDKQEEILLKQENLSEKNKLLERDKDKANIKPGQRVSGPLDQTVGEAFRQIKGFGKEIGQLGGDLFKGFGKLAGMVGRVAMGFLALLKPLIPFIIIAVMIGVVIYALYKAIKAVIDFFANIFDSISKIWPFSLLKDDDSKNEEIGDPNKTAVPGQGDKQSPQTETDIQKRTGQGQMVNRNEIDGETAKDGMTFEPGRDSDAMKILPINAEGGEDRRNISQMTKNVRSQNLNQMSVDNQALNESKPTNNTVVAPNISNSSVNASNTQVSSMEPTNFDRSFINLNSVAI